MQGLHLLGVFRAQADDEFDFVDDGGIEGPHGLEGLDLAGFEEKDFGHGDEVTESGAHFGDAQFDGVGADIAQGDGQGLAGDATPPRAPGPPGRRCREDGSAG